MYGHSGGDLGVRRTNGDMTGGHPDQLDESCVTDEFTVAQTLIADAVYQGRREDHVSGHTKPDPLGLNKPRNLNT